MSSKSTDEELKLTKEYKYLLSCIRPLIDQLDKSRDAQLCLLWLSKLEQCAMWERSYRNKILSELCKQVKSNCLKPPFSSSPPSGSLRHVVSEVISNLKTTTWNSNEYSEGDASTEEIMTSSSQHSCSTTKNLSRHQPPPLLWKGYLNTNVRNKGTTKTSKDAVDHSECFAMQKAYYERAQSDQMVIEKYQDIIKSLATQQLKAEVTPNKLKKLQCTYENKMGELVHALKKTEEENTLLRKKIECITAELTKLDNIRTQNEHLKKQVKELEGARDMLENKIKQIEEEKLITLTNLIGKLNETEKKLKDNDKCFKALQRKYEENFHNVESERLAELNEREKKCFAEVCALKKLLEEKQVEVTNLKEQLSKQSSLYEQEVSRLKQDFVENSNLCKDKKKIKVLKQKAKKLEKIKEHMAVVYQSHLQQILAKKDFYIATLEMQLKINNSENGGSNLDFDLHNALNQKVSNLESIYRKLLEDSEHQSIKQRQLDLQKIHTLEKQLLLYGELIEEKESSLNALKSKSLTSLTKNEVKPNIGQTFLS